MYASTFLFAAFMALARVAIATPPACLLAAVQAQPNPADLKSLCGTLEPQLAGNITEKCSGDAQSAAISAYSATCLSSESVTITISVSSSQTGSSSATTTGSSTGSASAKATGSSTPTGSGSGSSASAQATGSTGTNTATGATASQTGSSSAGSTSPQLVMVMAPVLLAAGFAGQFLL